MIDNLFKIIETNLFGRYFISMSNGYNPMTGEFNTSDIKLPELDDLEQCKELLDYLYKSKGLVDSKYGIMGTYYIKSITFDVCPYPTIGYTYLPTLIIDYKFSEIDWSNVK